MRVQRVATPEEGVRVLSVEFGVQDDGVLEERLLDLGDETERVADGSADVFVDFDEL